MNEKIFDTIKRLGLAEQPQTLFDRYYGIKRWQGIKEDYLKRKIITLDNEAGCLVFDDAKKFLLTITIIYKTKFVKNKGSQSYRHKVWRKTFNI